MKRVSKSFPGVQALDGVDFSVQPGEVHALVGENGAGKSTLVKILTGVYPKDRGEILLNGRPVDIRSPLDAQRLGLRVIHQEFTLINHLSVAENIFLDTFATGMVGRVPRRQIEERAREVLTTLGLDVDPRTPVAGLTVAEQQIVEIARAVSKEAVLIIMDEPTAALTEAEVERLFGIIGALKARGVAVIYISHKLDEVMAIADRITVLRDGRLVGVRRAAEVSRSELVRMMVGRPVEQMFARRHRPSDEALFEVSHVTVPGRVYDASFFVRRGEVVGITGLMGAGQSWLVRAIFGAVPTSAGDIRVGGRRRAIRSPADAVRAGIGLLTENRKEEGLVLSQAVAANVTLASLGRFGRLGLLDHGEERRVAAGFVRQLDIRTPALSQEVAYLSGGNQQKVVLAKWLATEPDVVVMAEPTRGIDVGAKAEIYRLIDGLARQGKAIVLVSSELPELRSRA
ncbi:MAG: sugar ABC transporter ATP-binding protein [Bacillota bacterium]